MTMVFQRELDLLRGKSLSLAARVEDALRKSVTSVFERDDDLARRVIEGDSEIDRREVELEEECLKVLALHQPVAVDLRLVVAVIKLDNELERIGDLAVDIAERSVFLARRDPIAWPTDLSTMATRAQAMLRQAIDALVNADPVLARQACAADDEVDTLHRRMFEHVEKAMKANPERIEVLLPLLSISRYLERIADHATNIAEDVIYLVEGAIVRHERL